jgi:hypothetical protein
MRKTIVCIILISILLVSCGKPDQTAVLEGMGNFILSVESVSTIVDEHMDWDAGNEFILDTPDGFPICNKPVQGFLIRMFGRDTAVNLVMATCLANHEGVIPGYVDFEKVLKRWNSFGNFDPETVTDRVPFMFACVEALGGTPQNWQEIIDLPKEIQTIKIPKETTLKKMLEMDNAIKDFELITQKIIENMETNGVPAEITARFYSAFDEVNFYISEMTDSFGGVSIKHPTTKKILFKNLAGSYLEVYGIELDEGLSILGE